MPLVGGHWVNKSVASGAVLIAPSIALDIAGGPTMADTIQPGVTKVTLTAVYTFSDGTTQPADDAVWTSDNPEVVLGATTGSVIDVTGNDRGDGSLSTGSVTASGSGFEAISAVDVQASVVAPPVATITGIVVTSSGAVPA